MPTFSFSLSADATGAAAGEASRRVSILGSDRFRLALDRLSLLYCRGRGNGLHLAPDGIVLEVSCTWRGVGLSFNGWQGEYGDYRQKHDANLHWKSNRTSASKIVAFPK